MKDISFGHTRKVQVSRTDVALFNSRWPASTLRATRSYWFEFDQNGDLIDVDVPQQDDGPAASAMADDCKAWLFDGEWPEWNPEPPSTGSPKVDAYLDGIMKRDS